MIQLKFVTLQIQILLIFKSTKKSNNCCPSLTETKVYGTTSCIYHIPNQKCAQMRCNHELGAFILNSLKENSKSTVINKYP